MADFSTFVRTSVEDWMAREHVSGRRFGEISLGDPGLVAQLRSGRSLQLRTADRLLVFMGMEPVGPAFRREVDAFLAATGLKVSLFGEMAAGDPSFVARLRRGASPTLTKVDRVRAWMAAHAGERERAAVAGPHPRTAPQPLHQESPT